MGHSVSTAGFAGMLCLVAGIAIVGAFVFENWKIKWRFWDEAERRAVWLGGIAAVIGTVFICCGCGGSQPEPADPVMVEVVVCDPELGGTAGQYLRLANWRRREGICEAILEGSEYRQQEIRFVAESDAVRLEREFDAYRASGRTDCYNGPVFRELQRLVEEKR